MQDITFDIAPTLLLREWLGRSYRRTGRNSAWRSIRARGGHDPSVHHSVAALIGHLIYSSLMFLTLLVLTSGLGFLFAWLNKHQPLSDEDVKVISKLKTLMLYFDAILCASVSIAGLWTFLKGAMR